MKNKVVKVTGAFILASLVLLHISTYMSPSYQQEQLPDNVEFSVPIASAPTAFISVWDTTRTSDVSSGSNQVHLPLESIGTYNLTVYWGDGTSDTITIWDQAEVTHTYASAGTYTITITGTIVGWCFTVGSDGLSDGHKIIEIQQWGCLQLGNSGSYFYGCWDLKLTATDNLNLTGTTNLHQAFRYCHYLGSSGNMDGWDVSSVTDMSRMFQGAGTFNQPIGNWDVSSVTDMSRMFDGASSFNQPLKTWDVSSVTNMICMFYGAFSFNQPLKTWDVSSVTNMICMFSEASSFNQPLGTWDVSSVTNMDFIFAGVVLSTPNYDNLLLGWSKLSLQSGVNFHAGKSTYSSATVDARQAIITNFGWTITDGGPTLEILGYNIPLLLGSVGLIGLYVAKKKLVGNLIS